MEVVRAVLACVALARSPEAARVAELGRFPGRDEAVAGRRACSDYLAWLKPRVSLNADVPEFGWGRHKQYAGRVWSCWNALEDAHKNLRYGDLKCMGENLDKLKAMLDDDAYAGGRMPPVLKKP